MRYMDIIPELHSICREHPQDCTENPDTDCPYIDICHKQRKEGGSFGEYKSNLLARYIKLHGGEPQKKFYFSFGSDPGFPFQNTFIIVVAETEKAAVEKFRKKYPDRHEGIVNCAFWYSEESWHRSKNETDYGEPAEVIA